MQGCPLSATLFNVAFTDLEEDMSKVQAGGLVTGGKKIWTIAYANDVVLLARSEYGMKKMLENFEKYIQGHRTRSRCQNLTK